MAHLNFAHHTCRLGAYFIQPTTFFSTPSAFLMIVWNKTFDSPPKAWPFARIQLRSFKFDLVRVMGSLYRRTGSYYFVSLASDRGLKYQLNRRINHIAIDRNERQIMCGPGLEGENSTSFRLVPSLSSALFEPYILISWGL